VIDTLKFTVVGDHKIHCASCEARIDRALKRVLGVQNVEASASTQQVRVTYDPDQTDPGELRGRLDTLGYEVKDDPVPQQ
jgi:copper chaperone CopZ